MAYSINTDFVIWAISFVAFLSVGYAAWIWGPWSWTRREVVLWGVGWVALWTAEYWIFGGASFLLPGDEGGG